MAERKKPTRAIELDGSYADAFAQRSVLAGFLLNTLGKKFVQQDSCREMIGPAAYRVIGKQWQRMETAPKLATDAARYFDEWFRLRRAAQPGTLKAFIDSNTRLDYLHGLENIVKADTRIGNSPNFLLLMAIALRALELNQPVGDESLYITKARLARSVLLAVLNHWTPDVDSQIELEAFPVGGWGEWSKDTRAGAGRAFKGMKIYQDRLRFSVSEDVARSFRQRPDIGVIDYLLSLAMDHEPLPIGAHLRWAMDLFSAAMAARTLVICEAMPDSVAKKGERTGTISFDAESLDGIMEWFCIRPDAIQPRPVLRMIERLPRVDHSEREWRTLWCAESLRHAAKLFHAVVDILTPGCQGLAAAWNRFSPPLLLAASTATSLPFERAISAAENESLTEHKLDAFASALEREHFNGVSEPPPSEYRTASQFTLGSDEWQVRMVEILGARMTHASDVYERAMAQNRRPTRDEYAAILASWPGTRTDVRNLTPQESMPEIRRAFLGVSRRKTHAVLRAGKRGR